LRRWHPFARQPLHLILLAILAAGVWVALGIPGARESHNPSIPVGPVVVISVVLGVLHQLWVALFWRLELDSSGVSRRFGSSGFVVFAVGFLFLFASRFASLFVLAPLNRATIAVPSLCRLIPAGALAALGLWGMDSVFRHFGIRRALGLDHFEPSIRRAGLVRGGAYRLTRNVMYVFVTPLFFLPALLWASVAGLVVGAFHYLAVWVHYYCTELPDMEVIYGLGSPSRPPTPAPKEPEPR
jgi:hypothetical protein